ncbi:SCO family protein [Vibrio sp. IRLE0018]|uniref:SCO family protein n=1 Tax=Vibrio TaxID=662 RepID=UPI0015942CAB|nr:MULTISPECIES: SCO family protein [Vibrio]MCF8778207.1 SCO family protein [Vibrio floridensis]NVC64943.1 SCO family protein [Vibrio sp. 05-20-BW147]HAS6348470.1 redoxin domain-containing protein [Vibrio vulnificus]
MNMNPVKMVLLAGALAIGIVIALYVDNTTIPIGERPKQFSELGGNFQLQSELGDINLADYQGQVVVLYFGFLNCSEVCPSSVGVMSVAFKMLPESVGKGVQGFFISVDPSRDDVTSLHEFTQYFDPRILGLTGTKEEIDQLTSNYGVYYSLVDMEKSVLDYTVDHMSRFYIIAPNGQLVDSMSHSTTPTELAARITRTIEQYAQLMKENL